MQSRTRILDRFHWANSSSSKGGCKTMPDSLASRLVRACAAVVVAKRKREGFGGRRLNNSNDTIPAMDWRVLERIVVTVQVAAYNPHHLYTFAWIRKTRQGLPRFEITYILVGTVPAFFCKTLGIYETWIVLFMGYSVCTVTREKCDIIINDMKKLRKKQRQLNYCGKLLG